MDLEKREELRKCGRSARGQSRGKVRPQRLPLGVDKPGKSRRQRKKEAQGKDGEKNQRRGWSQHGEAQYRQAQQRDAMTRGHDYIILKEVIIKTPRLYLVEAGGISRFLGVLRAALISTFEDNSLSIAKGAAYSSLLSFFPVLTTLAAILVQANATDVARTIATFLYQVVPPGTEDVVLTLFVVHGERPRYVLISAVLLALWAASGAAMSMIEGFRSIYRIPTGRSFLKERAMAVFLVLVSAAPIVGASALIVFGNRAESFLMHRLGVVAQDSDIQGWVELFSKALRFGLAFATFVLVNALLYYLGPNRKQSFANVYPGAILATVLWLISTLAFSWYVRHISNYNVLYGSVGAGLALLVWMYVWSVITLIGCEYNAARERLAVSEP
jgi:membrane protein